MTSIVRWTTPFLCMTATLTQLPGVTAGHTISIIAFGFSMLGSGFCFGLLYRN